MTSLAPERESTDDGPDELAGLATLVRFTLRRDRVKLPAWAGGLAMFVLYVTTAIPVAYSLDELESMSSLFRDPVGRMFIGPGFGFDDISYERMIANGYGLYLMLASALMSILLVVRHSRTEEQTGRAELVRANVVGTRAPLTATLVVAVIANLATGALGLAILVGIGGFGVQGSLLLMAAVVAVGLAFAGLTVLTAQITEYPRAAAGISGGVLGASFLVRAAGDMVSEGGSALSWLSPLGWGQQTAPFVLDRWWPLLLLLGLGATTTAVGYSLSTRRDLGAGLLVARPGRSRARPILATPLGLALRLQRAGIIGWGLSLSAAGLLYGAYADALRGAIDDMPDVFIELFGADDLLAGYLGYMAVFNAYLTSCFAIMAVQRLRDEETSGRAEPLLATPLSRARWLGTNLAITAVAAVGILAATGICTGIGAAIVTGQGSLIAELTAAHLNQVPPVLVVLGVAAFCFGAAPRLLPAVWAIPVYGMLAGTFGQLLDLPSLALDLSPFEHPARVPVEAFAPGPVATLMALAAATALLGLTGIRRREIDSK